MRGHGAVVRARLKDDESLVEGRTKRSDKRCVPGQIESLRGDETDFARRVDDAFTP
jgi:hypothetical protein